MMLNFNLTNLNLPEIYLVHINHFFTPQMKYVIWEMFILGNGIRGTVHWGNVLVKNCLFGEL